MCCFFSSTKNNAFPTAKKKHLEKKHQEVNARTLTLVSNMQNASLKLLLLVEGSISNTCLFLPALEMLLAAQRQQISHRLFG